MHRPSGPSRFLSAPGRRPWRGGRARGRDSRRRGLAVRSLALAYAGGIGAIVAAFALSPVLAFFAYPIVGVMLSRHVGRRATWLPEKASIRNVSNAKLGLVLRWPVELPALMARLLIVKYF